MRFEIADIHELELRGFSTLEPETILRKAARGESVANIPGDFVLIARISSPDGMQADVLVTSAVCHMPYFYFHDGDRFFYSPYIFEVYRQMPGPWRWDPMGVNSSLVAWYAPDLGTINADIKKLDPGAVYHFAHGKLTVDVDPFPHELYSQSKIGLADAFSIYDEICDDYFAERDIFLSLSAGYDSRVILASLLKRGISPICGNMGYPDSTDVRVARAMCRDYGLEMRNVQVEPEDFFAVAKRATEIGGGSKNAMAWITYIYPRKIDFPDGCLHLVGANGPWVKTNNFNFGILAYLAELSPVQPIRLILGQRYSNWHLMRTRKLDYIFRANPEVSFDSVYRRIAQSARQYKVGFLERLELMQAYHRGRDFFASGQAMYNDAVTTSSPFLDYRFMQLGAAIRRRHKLRWRFHRELIRRDKPELLKYPIDDTADTMDDKDKPLYWLERFRHSPSTPIFNYELLFEHPRMKELLHESPHLDMFVSRGMLRHLMEIRSWFALGFLVTMHHTCEIIAEIDREKVMANR